MSFGEGVLQGLDMYQGFSQQRRQNKRNDASIQLQREQQDIANYNQRMAEKKDRAVEAVAAIDGHLGADGIGTDAMTRDWGRLVQEKPELLAKLANILPGYTKFENEQGINVQGEIVGFDKRKDERGQDLYIPQIKRFDTEQVVPMTQGRSANSNDPVIQLTAEQLKEKMDGLWQTATANGGLENKNSYYATRNLVLSAAQARKQLENNLLSTLKATTLNAVDDDGGATPVAKSEFADIVLGINDVDELLKVAEAQGVDIQELRASAQAETDAQIAASAPEGSLEKLLYENGVTRETWEDSDEEKRKLIVKRLNQKQNVSELIDETAGRTAAQLEELVASPFDKLVNAGNRFAESAVGRFFGLSEVTDDPTPPRQNTAVKDKEAEIERQQGTRTIGEVSEIFAEPPAVELTAEGIRDAIFNKTANPTRQQQQEMNSFLNEKSIQNLSDLEEAVKQNKIAKDDALRVAFLAAMASEGTAQEKDKIAQNMMNLIERGAQDTTQYQQASIDGEKSARKTAQYEAKTDLERLRFEMKQYDDGAIPGVLEDAENLFNKVAKTAGLMDKEGNFTDDDFDATGDEARIMGREITKYMGLKGFKAMGPKSLEAHLAGMKASVGLYVQALANDDKNDFFSKENMLDFFRPDAVGAQAFDLRQVRVGSVRDGKAQSIAYVGPDGVVSQTVPLAEIKREFPQLARIVLTAAEANSKANK